MDDDENDADYGMENEINDIEDIDDKIDYDLYDDDYWKMK
jgi:hypothetical protein